MPIGAIGWMMTMPMMIKSHRPRTRFSFTGVDMPWLVSAGISGFLHRMELADFVCSLERRLVRYSSLRPPILYHRQEKEASRRKIVHNFSLASEELNRRDLRRLPAAANGLDQQHAGGHSARQNIYSGNFIRQRRALRRGHFQIIRDASFIAVQRKRDRMFGGSNRAILGLRLLLENAQRGKIVLHILERAQNSLAVIRNVLVVRGSRLFGNSAPFAGIKQRFNRCPSKRPQSARALNQCRDRHAFKTAATGKRDQGKISRSSNADLSVGFLHAPLGGSDVRTALEQLRRKTLRNRGRRSCQRHRLQTKFRRRLSNQDGDGVLECASLDFDVDRLASRGL